MSTEIERIVIAGAGQAGVQAALSLRIEGFTGKIALRFPKPISKAM
jgi:cation diffusion facilitator CzcD-associated flavoprotein CzcO